MGKRVPYTPASQITSALRRLWLRSRERRTALRREGNRCECCGVKASKAKGREVTVEVHHVSGKTRMKEIERFIRECLLVDPDLLQVLCKDCHAMKHGAEEPYETIDERPQDRRSGQT